MWDRQFWDFSWCSTADVYMMNFLEKSENAYREVRERVSRSRDVRENRVRVARKRTECIES